MVLEFSLKGKSILDEVIITSFNESVFMGSSWAFEIAVKAKKIVK